MKPAKIVVAVAALIGLVAIFLPYISARGMSMSLWDFSKIPDPMGTQGLLDGPKQPYVALVCFAIPLVLAGLALAKQRLGRAEAIGAGVFFLAAFAVEGVRKGMSSFEGMSTAVGGKLLFAAAVVGLIGAVIAVAKPEPRTA